MDINKIAGHSPSVRPQEHGRTSKNKAFSQMLDKAIDSVGPDGCSKNDAPFPMSGVIPSTPCLSGELEDRQIVQRASSLLDLMDKYAQALSNPKMTLKSIEPIVLQIRQALKGLEVQSSGQDDKLTELVNQISVTARVEAFKFERGDYVA